MGEEYAITDSSQYHILKKSLLQYELLQKAEMKNIAGTHWRKKLVNSSGKHYGYGYYFVIQNSMDGGSVFEIRVNNDHSYDTIIPNTSISSLMYVKEQEELEKIDIQQFQIETKTVLELYNMMWKFI